MDAGVGSEQGPQFQLVRLSIPRVRGLLERYPQLHNRLFTEGEIEFCRSRRRDPFQHFAARLAAKIALKRIVRPLGFREVEIVRSADGAPSFVQRNPSQLDGKALFLSLSHEAGEAAAYVAVGQP